MISLALISLGTILAIPGVSIVLGLVTKTFFYLKNRFEGLERIETNHLPHIQAALEEIPVAIERQTAALVAELREQRQDLRDVRTDLVAKL